MRQRRPDRRAIEDAALQGLVAVGRAHRHRRAAERLHEGRIGEAVGADALALEVLDRLDRLGADDPVGLERAEADGLEIVFGQFLFELRIGAVPVFHHLRDLDGGMRLRDEIADGVVEREFVGEVGRDDVAHVGGAAGEEVGDLFILGDTAAPEHLDFAFAAGALLELVDEPLRADRLRVARVLRLEGDPFQRDGLRARAEGGAERERRQRPCTNEREIAAFDVLPRVNFRYWPWHKPRMAVAK